MFPPNPGKFVDPILISHRVLPPQEQSPLTLHLLFFLVPLSVLLGFLARDCHPWYTGHVPLSTVIHKGISGSVLNLHRLTYLSQHGVIPVGSGDRHLECL